MVGCPDRRWLPHPPVARLPRRHVRSPGVAACPVGAGRRLAFRPERVVLGYGGVQVLRLAHGFRRPLVDAVGETVAQIGLTRDEVTRPMEAHYRGLGEYVTGLRDGGPTLGRGVVP